jgi:putative ABC transport system substrate-binding protein
MRRRDFITFLGSTAATWPLPARAQQREKLHRVFWVSTEDQPDPFLDGFREGLRERGYIEGKNVVFELRFARGNPDALRGVISELTRGNVDLVVCSGPAIRALRAATGIPVLFAVSGDPVELGLVKSLARPGGNFTGSTFLSLDLAGKRVDLLKTYFRNCAPLRYCRIRIILENARNGAPLSRPLKHWASIRSMFHFSARVN